MSSSQKNRSVTTTRPLAIGGAVLATGLLWLAARLLEIDLRVDQPGDGQPPVTVGLPLVIGATLVLSLLGWGALAVLERFTRRARTIWSVSACAVLLISFVPIAGVEAALGTKIILSLMHLAVAAVLIPMLRAPRNRA
ncbi:DUF6069 family protein [Nonomuraea bangladeshensis]|uniref:DUF6069 family protein n=1 Tax=Nonomuraea bangladeshensis TaxID=404385 RepID=UPI0031D87B1B